MNKILQAIRGVVGVSGVILWEKQAQSFHKLLPARFDEPMAQQLCDQLVRYCAIREKKNQLIARFQKGWIFLRNDDAFALMVLAKSDLNTTTLNLVIKTSISSLETNLGAKSVNNAPITGFLPEHGPILIRAINLSLGYLQVQISRFEIAELLRQAKTDLIVDYPCLKHFSVDANGGMILIKSAEKHLDDSAVDATARLIAAVIDLAKNRINTSGFDIEKLTAPLRDKLLGIGFYRAFKDSAKSKA
jgi:hypothetical protein